MFICQSGHLSRKGLGLADQPLELRRPTLPGFHGFKMAGACRRRGVVIHTCHTVSDTTAAATTISPHHGWPV